MPDNDNVVSLGNFLGLRNTLRSERLPKGSLSEADNIDVYDDGSIEIREGNVLSTSFTSATAAFATFDGDNAYIVDNGDLKRLHAGLDLTTLKASVGTDDMYWSEAGDKVYFSGSSQGYIHNQQVFDWGIPKPVQPAILKTPGTLAAGNYSVTYVYVSSNGEQGVAATPVTVTTDGTESLTITVTASAGYEALIFIASTDRNTFYRFVKTSDLTTLWDGPLTALSHPIEKVQLYGEPPPSFSSIAFHENRMWGSQYFPELGKSYVFSSEPFWYGIFDLFSSYATIQGQVLHMLSIAEGLIVGTDTQIGLISSAEDGGTQWTLLLEYGVVPGVSMYKREDGKAFIWTKRGLVTGPPFKNVTEEKVSVSPGATCNVNGVKQNGADRLLVLVDDQGGAFNQY